MRTIIAGSRNANYPDIEAALSLCPWRDKITVVLSGGATGADLHGEYWARLHKIEIEKHPADWQTHGKAAGHMRNKAMSRNADALVAIWDGKSKGTKSMIEYAQKAKLNLLIYRMDKQAIQENITEIQLQLV